jgi:hypothetical protein
VQVEALSWADHPFEETVPELKKVKKCRQTPTIDSRFIEIKVFFCEDVKRIMHFSSTSLLIGN